MTSEGGDPFPLTYGEYDATAPRWSRDGSHIAFVSNERGNTSLWVIDVPGGAKHQVVAGERRYPDPGGTLWLHVGAGAGPAPSARVSATTAPGRGGPPHDPRGPAD